MSRLRTFVVLLVGLLISTYCFFCYLSLLAPSTEALVLLVFRQRWSCICKQCKQLHASPERTNVTGEGDDADGEEEERVNVAERRRMFENSTAG